jgi:hypothetical protein
MFSGVDTAGAAGRAKAAHNGAVLKVGSVELRARGNAETRAAATPGLSPCLTIAKLQKALQWYDKAASAAATNPEWLSAHKNTALAYRKLAVAKAAGADYSSALHYQTLACYECSRTLCKCEGEDRRHSWADGLEQVFVLALREAADLVVQCAAGALDWREKARMISRVRGVCAQCREATAFLDAVEAEELVKAAICSDEAGDWRGTKNCVAEATQALERAKAILPLGWCAEADTSPAGVRAAEDLAARLGPIARAAEAAARETAGQQALYAARGDAAQLLSIGGGLFAQALPELLAAWKQLDEANATSEQLRGKLASASIVHWRARTAAAAAAAKQAPHEGADALLLAQQAEAAKAEAAVQAALDEATAKALAQESGLQDATELVWDAAGHFQHAVLVSRNLNIEGEAIASAKLGCAFNALRQDDLAKRWCKQAIELAQTIMADTGATFHSQPWYKGAAATVQELRQKQWAADQEELSGGGRKAVLAELKAELDAILQAVHEDKSLAKRAYDLIKHVYSTHPPKKSEWVSAAQVKITVLDGNPYAKKELKSFIVKCASLHYSADKNKEDGKQWIVLCQELQREFNLLMGEMKSLEGWQ